MKLAQRATIDFETRSACSLKNSGVWRYSIDPSTQPLCMAYRLPSWEPGRTALWHPAFRHLGIQESEDIPEFLELLAWIEGGGLVEAHNAFFERCIWQNLMAPEFGWPAIAPEQWRCSAAKAAACALPRKLEDAATALRLSELKDTEGGKVMKKMAKPRKARKAERESFDEGDTPTLYFEDRHLMEQLFAYCRQDVLAEEALSQRLPDLSPEEQTVYWLDQTINERGFQLDPEAVEAALHLIAQEVKDLNAELAVLTEGKVERASQRAQMIAWFAEYEDLHLPDTQKETIEGLLASTRTLSTTARRALTIMRTLGRSSTAKYEAMRHWMSPVDHRVRGGLLYHGATTGRWSGSGVQPHNFPKGTLKLKGEEKNLEGLWAALKRRVRQEIASAYSSVMEALSHGLRGAIVAAPGHGLYVADYASIEARVLLWLADDQEHLELFRQHADIYLDMAASIYGYVCTKDNNPKERGVGKIAVLGLGYQMGASKFVDTCALGGVTIEEDFGQEVVDAYRAKYWRVKQLWGDMEAAAIQAVTTGMPVRCGQVTWRMDNRLRFLFCLLPSGRRLCYPFPEVRERSTPWGAVKACLTYMGMDTYTRQWRRQMSYGGMLVENITQAVARDILAEALLRCEASGVYQPVLTVHDEIIAEAKAGAGDVKAFEQMMSQTPEWAPDCPIEAEGWSGGRYHK